MEEWYYISLGCVADLNCLLSFKLSLKLAESYKLELELKVSDKARFLHGITR